MEFIDVFPFILTRIMPGLLSPGSAEAYIGSGAMHDFTRKRICALLEKKKKKVGN